MDGVRKSVERRCIEAGGFSKLNASWSAADSRMGAERILIRENPMSGGSCRLAGDTGSGPSNFANVGGDGNMTEPRPLELLEESSASFLANLRASIAADAEAEVDVGSPCWI